MTYIVVPALAVVIILVVVLVALGMRASRQARDQDEEWAAEEQAPPRGRRGAPLDEDSAYGSTGYGGGGFDRRVAGAPLSAPPVIDTPPQGGMESYDYPAEYPSEFPPAEPERMPERMPERVPERLSERVPERPAARGLSRSAARQAAAPSPRRSQATEEMEDDDYWATITFDKPKFPWQHDNGRDRPVGEDPLAQVAPPEPDEEEFAAPAAPVAPAAQGGFPDQNTGPHGYDPGYGLDPVEPLAGRSGENLGYDPYDSNGMPQTGPQPVLGGGPARTTGPQQLPDPLAPAARDWDSARDWDGAGSSGGRDWDGAGSIGTGPMRTSQPTPHPAAEATQNFSLGGFGGNPLNDPSPLAQPSPPVAPPAPATPPPAAPPAPAAPVLGGGAQHDSDGHRLPTVDELLQRIQSDRARSAAESGSGSSPAFGGDPLSDPLNTSGSSWSASSSAGSANPAYDATDPLGTASGYSSGGYRAPSGYSSDGYPTAPAVGPRSSGYDEPLGTFGSGGGNRESYGSDSYGSYSGQSDPLGGGRAEPGQYGDFSGSSYSGSDAPRYSDPGYGTGGYSDQSYGAGGPYGGRDQQQNPPNPNSSDDWDNYRDFRR